MSPDAYIQWLRFKTTVVDIWNGNSEMCIVVGAIVIAVSIIGYTLHKCKKVPGEEPKMKKAEYILSKRLQKLREHSLLADMVGDGLLSMYTKGEITEERYKYWHMRFGTQLALKDLLPAKLTPEQIKDAMKKRIGNGVYRPVNLPKPKEDKVSRPKNIIDNILKRHQA